MVEAENDEKESTQMFMGLRTSLVCESELLSSYATRKQSKNRIRGSDWSNPQYQQMAGFRVPQFNVVAGSTHKAKHYRPYMSVSLLAWRFTPSSQNSLLSTQMMQKMNQETQELPLMDRIKPAHRANSST
jgi:hypothetical protein